MEDRIIVQALLTHWDSLPQRIGPDWEHARPEVERLLARLEAATSDDERDDIASELMRVLWRSPSLMLRLRELAGLPEPLPPLEPHQDIPLPPPPWEVLPGPKGPRPRPPRVLSWSAVFARSGRDRTATHAEPDRAESERAEPEQVARYVNVCIARHGEETCLTKATALAADRDYDLRLDIGELSPESAVENPTPVRTDLLPPSEIGHWLEVVAVSDELDFPTLRHALFLPRGAPAWVCQCPYGGDHTCAPTQRRPYLFVPFRTQSEPGTARVRLGVYYEKNLIQSQLLTAEIRAEEAAGFGYSSVIDYSLTAALNDVGFLPRRTLNILTNQNVDGTHRIVVNGQSDRVLAFSLNEGQMRDTVNAVRELLRNVHIRVGTDWLGRPTRTDLFDANNVKKRDDFIEDLKRLAPLGWQLFDLVLKGDQDWWEELRAPAMIQVARTDGSTFVFPWALLYDLPIVLDDPFRLCPLLENWDSTKQQIQPTTNRCPFESAHRGGNVLCPFGFWGLKHVLEHPPSMPKDESLPLAIRPGSRPAEMIASVSLNLDAALTRTHLDALRRRLQQFTLVDCDSLAEVVDAMASRVGIVYFYCHGKREPLPGTTQMTPYIEVGSADKLRPSDITAWRMVKWPPRHWKGTAPLVVINGCHTAELTPESIVNFVDAFAMAYAAGVIGTEITVAQKVANEAAQELFGHLQSSGTTVGEALHRMRVGLVTKGNLLGLAYTPYCSAALTFAG